MFKFSVVYNSNVHFCSVKTLLRESKCNRFRQRVSTFITEFGAAFFATDVEKRNVKWFR